MPRQVNRDFWALWVGQTTSALGTSVSAIAYPLLVLALTGSALLAGAVGTVLAATTFVLRIPASVVADRVHRKRLMLICDGGRVLAVGSLGIAVLAGHASMVHVFAVALTEAVFGVLFGPAETVAIGRVVKRSEVRRAIAVNQSRQALAGLVGPSLGGALFGLGRGYPSSETQSPTLSFVMVSIVRQPLGGGRADRSGAVAPRRWQAELTEGLRWLWL